MGLKDAKPAWLGFAAAQQGISHVQKAERCLYWQQVGRTIRSMCHQLSKKMRTESKLASMRGVFQKFNLQDVLQSARRVMETTAERSLIRPLRDIDEWSDQSEVAFHEEIVGKRA